jgi:hypothetical protein
MRATCSRSTSLASTARRRECSSLTVLVRGELRSSPPRGYSALWERQSGTVARGHAGRAGGSCCTPSLCESAGVSSPCAVIAGDGRRCFRRCAAPVADTETSPPHPGIRRRAMNPRSLASSQTGRLGHEVRHDSITSAYGRGSGPIHSRRSRIRASTVSDAGALWIEAGRSIVASFLTLNGRAGCAQRRPSQASTLTSMRQRTA